ncbi:hypothetical protein [Stomatohabitans albus]|uniref:hypothetical protein n=1 Tax=Stomatohabitans albus TaxID=3110766 RepID=UPI00300DA371
MVSLKLTRTHMYCIPLVPVGLALAAAGLAQANEQDNVVDQIGNQFRSELNHIESIAYGLPSGDTSHVPALKLTTDAQNNIKALTDERVSAEAVPGDHLKILSSDVQYVGHHILKKDSNSTIVKYQYIITRETEDLKGEDAWQEAPEFVMVIDTDHQVVKEIDWISEDEAHAIRDDAQSDIEDGGVTSGTSDSTIAD